MPEIEELQQELAQAEARAAALRQEAETAAAQAAADRHAAQVARARGIVDRHSAEMERLNEEVAAASKAFREEIVDYPLVQAYARMRGAYMRMSRRYDLTVNAKQVLNPGVDPGMNGLRIRDNGFITDLVQAIDKAAANEAEDYFDALYGYLQDGGDNPEAVQPEAVQPEAVQPEAAPDGD